MSLAPHQAPKPLPSIPCPTYDGHRITWQAWSAAPDMTHVDPSCDTCAFPGPLSIAFGAAEPNPGETFTVQREKKLKSGRTYLKDREVAAWRVLSLLASLCPSCLNLNLMARAGRGAESCKDVPAILCDSCDRYCAAGATYAEARTNLIALGGWTAGDPKADWDLCPECNPNGEQPTSLRAKAVIKASGEDR